MAIFQAIFTHSCIIHAPKEKVWQILTDTDSYPDWNSFTPKTEVKWELGSPVRQEVFMPGAKKPIIHKAVLSQFEEGSHFAWKMKIGSLLWAERKQGLEGGLSEDQTRYFTIDDNRGVMAPLVAMIYGKKIEAGFKVMAEALKQRAENE